MFVCVCVEGDRVSKLLFIYLFCFVDGSLLEQKKVPSEFFLKPSNQISQKLISESAF